MRKAVMSGGAVVLALSLAASPLRAANLSGGVLGWVEDPRGAPISGAVISLFRGGAGGAGLVTLSDSAGRFFLPSLPAGSYTLRALRPGHAPAPLRQVVVLPNQDATFTVSLTPLSDSAARTTSEAQAEAADEAVRETQWLLRHKRRSVLEARREAPVESAVDHPEDARLLASILPDLDGTVEVLADHSAVGMGPDDDRVPGSLSVLRLKGRIAESGRWSLGGVMAERESTTWRMAAEFVIEPVEGHEVRAATGYGSRYLRAAAELSGEGLHDRGVGALSVEDRWEIVDGVTASVGGRFSYVGFLGDPNHFDPSASLEIEGANRTTYRATVYARTVAPGGDILTLNSLAAAPAMSFAVLEGALRAERLTRYELAMDQQMGGTSVGAFTYYEGVRDQLANVFEGASDARALRIFNGGNAATGAVGVTVGRCFGESVRGSMSYTFGRSRRDPARPDVLGDLAVPTLQGGNFHDLAARVETVFQGTDTRVAAYYRLNRMMPDADVRSVAALTNRRFDVQVSQGLPFLGAFTRADWNVLLAVRNLFYETSEGALIDEVAVTNPPKRVLGGIAVRF